MRQKEADGKWYLAVIPVLTVLLAIVFMLFYTGMQKYGPENF